MNLTGWMLAQDRTNLDRVWPFFFAAGTAVTIEATTIGVDLWFVEGAAAMAAAFLYSFATSLLVIWPHTFRLHVVAMPGALVLWFGRAAAALVRYVETGEVVLLTVVAPAVMIGVAAATLHLYAIRYIAAHDALRTHSERWHDNGA